MTIVDYACGSGQYAVEYAKIVGNQGKVYAVDINPLAFKESIERAESSGLHNIEIRLANGFDSTLETGIADVVTALDVFFMIENPADFLAELNRICKPDGILIIDDGHQPRSKTIEILYQINIWEIFEETRDHLKCKKII